MFRNELLPRFVKCPYALATLLDVLLLFLSQIPCTAAEQNELIIVFFCIGPILSIFIMLRIVNLDQPARLRPLAESICSDCSTCWEQPGHSHQYVQFVIKTSTQIIL